jgi:hypothetical protein
MNKKNKMLSSILPIMAMAAMDDRFWDVPTPTIKIKQKQYCLNCGKEKNHNNSFCSPECCKNYKHKQRKQKCGMD